MPDAPPHSWWTIHVVVAVGVYTCVAISIVKAVWIRRIERFVRQVTNTPPVAGPPGSRDQNMSAIDHGEMVTTFEVRRKIHKLR